MLLDPSENLRLNVHDLMFEASPKPNLKKKDVGSNDCFDIIDISEF